jgi:hypothetical protein
MKVAGLNEVCILCHVRGDIFEKIDSWINTNQNQICPLTCKILYHTQIVFVL